MKKRSIKNLKLKKVKISNFKAEKIKAGSYLPHICIAQTIIYGGTVVASWLAGCNDDKKKEDE